MTSGITTYERIVSQAVRQYVEYQVRLLLSWDGTRCVLSKYPKIPVMHAEGVTKRLTSIFLPHFLLIKTTTA